MVNTDLEVINTNDGSNSIYSKQYDATYHSRHGALAESKHVFIDHGLKYLHDKGINDIKLLEVGFGSGLNAMLSAEYAKNNNLKINYFGIEKHPFPEGFYESLDYHGKFDESNKVLIDSIIKAPYGLETNIIPQFTLNKILTDFSEYTLDKNFNLVFYDAFAPRHVPHMWTKEVFEKLYHSIATGGALVTFCAQGQFKRDLKDIGYEVHTLPGAPGKREMTRAVKS